MLNAYVVAHVTITPRSLGPMQPKVRVLDTDWVDSYLQTGLYK